MSDEGFGGPANYEPAPGHNLAEQISIGAAMTSRDLAEEIAAIVTSGMFYKPAHQTIFAAVERVLNTADVPVSPATILSELARMGDVEKVGGGPYLHTCFSAVPAAANGPYYAERVRADYRRRDLWAAGMRVVQYAGSPSFDTEMGFEQARGWIDNAATDARDRGDRSLEDLTRELLEAIEDGTTLQPGLRTGLIDLDAMLNGLRPNQLIVVAARPSMGKSVIGLNLAAAVAIRQGKRVHLHSMEMSDAELTLRLMSAESMVSMSRIQAGQLEDRHWERLAKAMPNVAYAPLKIDDSSGQTVATIRGKLRAAARHDPAALVVVDYLQLLRGSSRTESRQQEVAENVRELKNLAREFNVPVVALAQLNRNPEQRGDKRPMLADLRETGETEQAADVVILLHREDYYEKESPRSGEMDLIVAKQRNGPTGTVTVAQQFHYARVMDLARF